MDADKVKKLTELAKRQHTLRLEGQRISMTNVYALDAKGQLDMHIKSVLNRAEQAEIDTEINNLSHRL